MTELTRINKLDRPAIIWPIEMYFLILHPFTLNAIEIECRSPVLKPRIAAGKIRVQICDAVEFEGGRSVPIFFVRLPSDCAIDIKNKFFIESEANHFIGESQAAGNVTART